MSTRNRWIAFVNSVADRMERDDPKAAALFRKINEASIPPDEKALEWGMAYITAQQALLELLDIYYAHGRHEEAMILASYMLELNQALGGQSGKVKVLKEFTKEVKF